MQVKIGKYPSRLTCHLYEDIMDIKYGYMKRPDKQTKFDSIIEDIDGKIQDFYNIFNRLWFDEQKQKVKVHIDPWDTWSMDYTLALIALPMLKRLKETKQGSPIVDNEDVPTELRSNQSHGYGSRQMDLFGDEELNKLNDELIHKRWEWVLDEMIWAFEQIIKDDDSEFWGEWIEDDSKILGGYHKSVDWEGRAKYNERIENGLRLFGKYYRGLWD